MSARNAAVLEGEGTAAHAGTGQVDQAPNSGNRLEAAHDTRRRFRGEIFALPTGSKTPATKWRSLPAMSGPDVQATWDERPQANIAVRTGEASGIFVLDVDRQDVLADLGGELPDTFTVRTPRGQHFYFELPGDFVPTNARGQLPAGIDVRGEGGYVVGAGSTVEYVVERDLTPAPAPEWLLALIRPVKSQNRPSETSTAVMPLDPAERQRLTHYTARAVAEELARLDAMGQAAKPNGAGYDGEPWDATTFEVACSLRELANAAWNGYGLDRAHRDLLDHAPRDAGFTTASVEAKWRSASSKVGTTGRPLPESSKWGLSAGCQGGLAPSSSDTDEAEEFWQEREVLTYLRDFARSRLVSPWAVLGVALARTVAATPCTLVLPPLVGSFASLNLFVALVGPSGMGKGAAEATAADALDVGHVDTASVGSGEGIGHLFARRERGEVIRTRERVLFSVPEVDTLTALGSRQGATLLPELRKAWSGERLGFAYADPAKALPIERHTYRMSLVMGVQPDRAAGLLDDTDGGTPQRFVWLPTTDPHAVENWPAPDRSTWPLPPQEVYQSPLLVKLAVPREAAQAIAAARVARVRGEGDALDGHALLARLKVAAALALLDGRRAVTGDDWRLAGVVMGVSDRTRASVQTRLAQAQARTNEARGKAEGVRAAVAAETAEARQVQRIARKLLSWLRIEGPSTRGALRRRLNSHDRRLIDEAIEALTSAGQVTVQGEEISASEAAP